MRFLYIVILFASVNLLSESIYNFQNTEDEIRFNNLVKEIRCPKCTSGSLASSNAPISQDLKLKIVEMINNNKSDEEIKEYISENNAGMKLWHACDTIELLIRFFVILGLIDFKEKKIINGSQEI